MWVVQLWNYYSYCCALIYFKRDCCFYLNCFTSVTLPFFGSESHIWQHLVVQKNRLCSSGKGKRCWNTVPCSAVASAPHSCEVLPVSRGSGLLGGLPHSLIRRFRLKRLAHCWISKSQIWGTVYYCILLSSRAECDLSVMQTLHGVAHAVVQQTLGTVWDLFDSSVH